MVLIYNFRHPFFGSINIFSDRNVQFFVERRNVGRAYLLAAEAIKMSGCREVALVMGGDDWEYPLWSLTHKEGVVFRHIGQSGYAETGFVPCAMIDTVHPRETAIRIWGQKEYEPVLRSPVMAVFLQKTAS